MTIADRIHKVVRAQHMNARAVDLNVNTSLRGELRAKPVDVLCLMIDIETEFEVELGHDEISRLETLGDIERLLAEKLGVAQC